MKTYDTKQLTLKNIEARHRIYGAIILNKEKFIRVLDEVNALNNLSFLKNRIIK